MIDKVMSTNISSTKIKTIKENSFNYSNFPTQLTNAYELAANPEFGGTSQVPSPNNGFAKSLGVLTDAFSEKPSNLPGDCYYYPLDKDLNSYLVSTFLEGYTKIDKNRISNVSNSFKDDSGFSDRNFYINSGVLSNQLKESDNLLSPDYNPTVWSPNTSGFEPLFIVPSKGFDGIKVTSKSKTQPISLRYEVTIIEEGDYCFSFFGRVNNKIPSTRKITNIGFFNNSTYITPMFNISSSSDLKYIWNHYSSVTHLTPGTYKVGFNLPTEVSSGVSNLDLPFKFSGFRVEKKKYPTFEDPRFVVDREAGIKFPVLFNFKKLNNKELDSYSWSCVYKRYLTFNKGNEERVDNLGNINISLLNQRYAINTTEFEIGFEEGNVFESNHIWETVIIKYNADTRELSVQSLTPKATTVEFKYPLNPEDSFDAEIGGVYYNLSLGMDSNTNMYSGVYKDLVFFPYNIDVKELYKKYFTIDNHVSPFEDEGAKVVLTTTNIIEGEI